jgi:regulator of RNase E activity RraA
MRTGKDRVRVEATQVPVSIGGIRVEPGDLLRGDGDGLVVVPAARGEEIIAVAVAIEEAEQAIREAVQSGVALRDARAQFGYHGLQHLSVEK